MLPRYPYFCVIMNTEVEHPRTPSWIIRMTKNKFLLVERRTHSSVLQPSKREHHKLDLKPTSKIL